MKGERIKEFRLKKGYTLADLGKKTGFTASFLSQIERGIKSPSLASLRKIADCLGVSVLAFIVDEDDSYLIRKDKRKKIVIPEIGTEYEFITPISPHGSIEPNMGGIYVELKPKNCVSEGLVRHDAQQSIYVIEGQIDVHLSDEVYRLNEGDSFYIQSNVPHNIMNSGDKKAIIISYVSPSLY